MFRSFFFSFLISSFLMVSAEIHSLFCAFLLPRISSHVSHHSFLPRSHCVSMSVSLSSISFCSGWYLLERLILKAACVSLFLRSPTLYFVCVLFVLLLYHLSRNFTVVARRWRSDDTSAPLIARTDLNDNLASQAEKAAGQGNLWDLYLVTRKLAGKFQRTD